MKRRAIVIGLVVVAAVVAGGAFLLERALRPCEPLDLQLQRSGCIRVIDLPPFHTAYLHASNVGNQLAVVSGPPTDSPDVLILSTETWMVLDQLPITEIEAADVPEASQTMPRYQWNTTQLLRGIYPRVGFLSARVPDGGVYALVEERGEQVSFFDGATDDLISTIDLPSPASTIGGIALSHDGGRFLVPLSDGRLTAWDVKSGELIFAVALDSALLGGFDWLADNQTIVVALRRLDERRDVLALFHVP
ncbi:MAG: hypothetical protein SNJ83_02330 [Aggregatilineales bacterium]